MGAFEYRQARELADALARHKVRYLFIGKSAAILLGFPDTTQDADLFVERGPDNGRALAAALLELGFDLTAEQAAEIERGKDVCHIDDVIASKAAAGRVKDRESLPRLRSFREYWVKTRR
jgi:hypothetical protein